MNVFPCATSARYGKAKSTLTKLESEGRANSASRAILERVNQQLSGQQLSGQQLSGQQLSGQQLSGQQLSGL